MCDEIVKNSVYELAVYDLRTNKDIPVTPEEVQQLSEMQLRHKGRARDTFNVGEAIEKMRKVKGYFTSEGNSRRLGVSFPRTES